MNKICPIWKFLLIYRYRIHASSSAMIVESALSLSASNLNAMIWTWVLKNKIQIITCMLFII